MKIEKEKPPTAPIVVITAAMKRAMKEETMKKEKMDLEARILAVKKDVLKSLGMKEGVNIFFKVDDNLKKE